MYETLFRDVVHPSSDIQHVFDQFIHWLLPFLCDCYSTDPVLCYKLSNLLLGSFLDHHVVETQAQSKVDLHDIVVNVCIKLNCRIIVFNLL